ncbi:hypothetical protein [Frankia sp. CiP1_Cm_nod1]|uniref:hypothetical protein n=1 Tax=Frankia sp. CiP1_Cm_nod1 TaxID=2897160 RepID=UPI0020250374
MPALRPPLDVRGGAASGSLTISRIDRVNTGGDAGGQASSDVGDNIGNNVGNNMGSAAGGTNPGGLEHGAHSEGIRTARM